jgi:hypothetical protein
MPYAPSESNRNERRIRRRKRRRNASIKNTIGNITGWKLLHASLGTCSRGLMHIVTWMAKALLSNDSVNTV